MKYTLKMAGKNGVIIVEEEVESDFLPHVGEVFDIGKGTILTEMLEFSREYPVDYLDAKEVRVIEVKHSLVYGRVFVSVTINHPSFA